MKHTKTYLALSAILFSNLFIAVFAQEMEHKDSIYISKTDMPQQKDFWNNTYNFPAKPRNMWEVGASFGVPTISGDIAVILPTFGFSAHVRKSIGYLFSVRVQYVNGVAKGMMWQPSPVNTKNPAWLDNSVAGFKGNLPLGQGYNATYRDEFGNLRALSPILNGGKTQLIYANYKTNLQDLSIQGIITLNNVRFHKDKTKFTIYGGAGIGFTAYHVMVNALDEKNGKNYTGLFNSVFAATGGVNGLTLSNNKNIIKLLKAGMDNTYETAADSEKGRRGSLGNNVVRPSGTVLFGLAYKLGKRINLALEDRHSFIKTDLLDGQQWQVHSKGDVVLTRDFDSWNYASLGININLGAKSVEPLWWLNPMDYAYSELNNPKHMKLPKITFEDVDGDGVLDQLDREPNTPVGYPVDMHGVSKDTDGDGVPDWKDKQLITPTECQPVDGDGIGRCPEPECCKTNIAVLDSLSKIKKNCPDDYKGFVMKTLSIDNDIKARLAIIAATLKNYPDCKIEITSYPKTNKRIQKFAEKKMEIIRNYLTEVLGITIDRISTNKIIEGGNPDQIDIKSK
jgi:hypothetical protein